MSVSSTINRVSYAGDGVTLAFGTSPVIFYVAADLAVYDVVTATGVATLKTLTTDYTVTGGAGLVGTVTMLVAPLAGHTLLVVRTVALTQGVTLVNNDASDAKVLETAFDRLTLICQQLSTTAGRSFTLADSDVSGASTLVPTPVATSLLGWNLAGTALQNYTTATLSLALTTAYTLTLLVAPDAPSARVTLGFPAVAAKGDLFVGTAANTLAKKTAGIDGYALRPSSAASDGLAWTGPSNFDILNGSLTATVAANALTVALKGLDGNDPSDTNPVFISFRSATASVGTPTIIKVAAATSIVVPSTATLGTSNGVAARIWIVGFNDAGTFRMGVVNTLSGVNIMPLRDNILASSTLTPANSAQVIYTTGAAVTAKAMRLLGYIEATEATAGTWATAPSVVQLFGPGVPLPGSIVQTARTDTGAFATGTTVIPLDDTIPQITEGDQYMTQAITPTSAINLLRWSADVVMSNSAVNYLIAAFFQDATANALASAIQYQGAGTAINTVPLIKTTQALTTATVTARVRAGGSSAGTTTFNGQAGARVHGGVFNSFIEMQEVFV